MIEIYRSKQGILGEQQKFAKGSWVNVVSPSEEDIKKLSELANIPEELITCLKDPDEQPRTEKENGVRFVLVRTPQVITRDDETEYVTVPLGIFLLKDLMITVSYGRNEVVERLKQRSVSTKKKIQTILRLSLLASQRYLQYLKEIKRKTYVIQKELEESMKNEELICLMDLENSLVFFNTSIRANIILLEKLCRTHSFTKFEEDKELLDDVLIESKQALEMTNIYSNILSGMMDAFASVISNNLNRVMKFLTSVTIILMIPTLLASIYGMNIALPFQKSPQAFAITMSMSIFLSLIGIIIFWRKEIF